MRIAIDAGNLTGAKTGLDYMTEGIIKGFAPFPEHELLVYTTQHYQGEKSPSWITIPKPTGFASGLRWYRLVARDMHSRGVDYFVSTWTFTAAAMFPRTLQIVPDLSPMVLPHTVRWKQRVLFGITLRIALLRAWKVVAISQAVADEIKQKFLWYKKAVGVIPLSVNDWALSPQTPETERAKVQAKYQLPKKFFLSISTIQPRKNYVNMIKAFARLLKTHPDYEYVIVGKKGWLYTQVFDLVAHLNLRQKVRFLDYVTDQDLPALVDSAAGFLYASLYEGFGIPPLNAAYRGIPVLLADIPVAHETVTNQQAVFVDPHDVGSIVGGMQKLLTLKLRFGDQTLIAKYNWQNCAQAIILTCSTPQS